MVSDRNVKLKSMNCMEIYTTAMTPSTKLDFVNLKSVNV